MERAQREADGPRRRILEAARLRAAPRAPDPAPAPTVLPVNVVLPAPVPAPVAAPAARPASRGEAEGVVAVLSPAAVPQALPAAPPAMASVPTVAPVSIATALPAMISAPQPVQLEGLPPPRLVSRVDPDLPLNMFRRGARRTELVVDMVVNVDGSVKDVALRDSANPELETPVLEAVRQWRYERQPAARQHTVRLVVAPS